MNTPTNFKEQFINLKDKLETANYTITEFNVENAVEESTIELIEHVIQYALPIEIKQFYRAHNGLTLSWTNPDVPSLSGWIDIWPLERMFGGYYGDNKNPYNEDGMYELLWFDGHSEEELAFRKQLKMLEPHLGMSSATAIQVKSENDYKLFYSDVDLLIELPLGFSEYVQFLILTAGLNGLRYDLQNDEFYASPESVNFELNLLPKSLYCIDSLSFLKSKKINFIF
ncbi:MAG: hypothetical protein FGM14_13660 [Flavobacteriales bacterium]|nr:hypothetical protein [Flavobacteriales bacterium]